MTVQRYDLVWEDYETGYMEKSNHGDYVLFDDYEDALINAQVEFDTLKRDYDNLVKAIGELYRDA